LSRRTKKQCERFWLDLLLELTGVSPSEVVERERPDFALTLDGRRIGVEVTDLCDPQLEMHDSLSTRIIDKASKEFTAAGGPPLDVSVAFVGAVRRSSLQCPRASG
jgi:hypothetical protein